MSKYDSNDNLAKVFRKINRRLSRLERSLKDTHDTVLIGGGGGGNVTDPDVAYRNEINFFSEAQAITHDGGLVLTGAAGKNTLKLSSDSTFTGITFGGSEFANLYRNDGFDWLQSDGSLYAAKSIYGAENVTGGNIFDTTTLTKIGGLGESNQAAITFGNDIMMYRFAPNVLALGADDYLASAMPIIAGNATADNQAITRQQLPKFGQIQFHGHSLNSLGASHPDRAFPARVCSILSAELFDDSYPSQAQSVSNAGSLFLDGGWAWQFRHTINPKLRNAGLGVLSWESPRELSVFTTGYNDIGQLGARTTTVGSHTLPLSSPFELIVADNTLFDNEGVVSVTDTDTQYVIYSGKSGTTKLTGCLGGTGTIATGSDVFQWTATAGADTFRHALIATISRARADNVFIPSAAVTTDYTSGTNLYISNTYIFPTSGTFWVYNTAGDLLEVQYSGKTVGISPALTGCSGLTGTITEGTVIEGTYDGLITSGGTYIEAGSWPVIHGTSYVIYRVDGTGDYVQITTPADFPGGRVCMAFLVDDAQSGGTWNITNAATGTVSLENEGPHVPSAIPDWSWGVRIFRSPVLTAGAHTLRATWTKGVGTYGYFDSAWHEAQRPPMTAVCNQPYGPGLDQDIDVLNTAIDAAITVFNDDDTVFLVDLNSALQWNASYEDSDMADGVHFNDRGHRKAANEVVSQVLARTRTLAYSSEGNARGNGLTRSSGRAVETGNLVNRIDARSSGDTPLSLRASNKLAQSAPLLRIEDRFGNLDSGFDHDGYLLVKNGTTNFATTSTNEAAFSFPHATITVDDTSLFDSSGFFFLTTQKAVVKYTGKTATTFTGCTLRGAYAGTVPDNSSIQQGRGITFGGGSKIWEGLYNVLQISSSSVHLLGNLNLADGIVSIVTTTGIGILPLSIRQPTDTYTRFGVDTGGAIWFGDGTVALGDVSLRRSAADELNLGTGDTLKFGAGTSNTKIVNNTIATAGTGFPFTIRAADGDSNATFTMLHTGGMFWGAGGASAVDVGLSRTAANELTLAAGDHLITDDPTTAQQVATKNYVDGEAFIGLTYANNWTDFGSPNSNGGYYLKNGRVYLRGAVKRTSGSSMVINSALPAGYRPPATVSFVITAFAGPASCTVGADGVITLANLITAAGNISGGATAASVFASLEGVSWRV